jgi:hypothetical protein
MHLLQHSSSFFSLLHKKRSYDANLLHKIFEKKEMQCNVSLLYGKNIDEEFFSPLLQCKEKKNRFLCAFSTMQPFFFLPCTFATMQTCYMQEEKEAHLLLLFLLQHKKKNLFFLLHVFWLFFCYNISSLCGMQSPCYME